VSNAVQKPLTATKAPAPAVRAPVKQPEDDGKESAFDALKGLKSTWEIPGSDYMTTEEYYAAINKRIADMKKKRRQIEGHTATMVQDYFDSLSRPRKPAGDDESSA
jgi:hypothetical protein